VNKTPRLSKSGVEYLDYSWGIFSGCHNHDNGICPVKNCWAKGIALHYPKLYPDSFNPTYYPKALDSPKYLKKPSHIGVGWVGDIIGYGLYCKKYIYETIRQCPQHTFLFLTKNPENLHLWSPFPDNCFVGFTACNRDMLLSGCRLMQTVRASAKFVSIEPMLDDAWVLPSTLTLAGIKWVIIGSQSNPYKPPEKEWAISLVEVADKADCKVFLKNNLKPLLGLHIRQEFLNGHQ
jgi:protein gp37